MEGERRWERAWRAMALASAALVALSAIFGVGFHHPDEHFQTFELAGFWMGRTPMGELPWEFEARMRPWLQPALEWAVARALGDASPFTVAMACRALSGAATLASCVVVTHAIGASVRDLRARTWATFALWLGFWVPYLAVRTSSETTSAAALGAGVALVILATTSGEVADARRLVGAGALFGLAFELRFQSAIVVAGVLAWLVLASSSDARGRGRAVALVGLGALPALAVGAVLDRVGYGAWTFTPWNYLRANLLEGAAAEFGTAPPFAYLWSEHALPTALVTVPFMAAVLVGWARAPRHVATWAAAPFALVHALLAHKEDRFLFPLLPLAALAVGLALDRETASPRLRAWLDSRMLRAVGTAVAIANVPALLFAPFALRYPMMDCQRAIAALPAGTRVVLADDPYDWGGDLHLWFTRAPGVVLLPQGAPIGPGTVIAYAEPAPPDLPIVAGEELYRTPTWRTAPGTWMGWGPRSRERWHLVRVRP